MITATFRECRSVVSEANFLGGLVKGGLGRASAVELPTRKLESSRRALVVAHTHGASIQPVAHFTGLLPDSAQSPRDISSAATDKCAAHGESVRALFREAQIARLAGYCYEDSDTLRENVAAEGLRFLRGGDNYFTRWYIATGAISGNVPGDDTVELLSTEATPEEADTLHVFFRGVMWRNTEVETVKVWQKLSQSWGAGVPVNAVDLSDTRATPDDDPASNSGLVAHSGILDMAQELYAEMRPHLLQHSGPIRIAGHSLGGTLALLVASQFILAEEIEPTRLRLHAFGSPPALSHTSCSADISSNCGAHVRQRLRLPASQVRNWVLDFDPVPRATTAANPYLQVARRNEVFRSMYDLAGMAATALGVAHPAQRFFFRHVGHVFMLTHSDPAADNGIRKLPEASADEELAQAPVVGRGEGFRPRVIARELLRSVLDHTHTSYAHDLLVSAKLALQRYGVDGVVGSSAPLPSLDSMGGNGNAVPSGLSTDILLQRRMNSSSLVHGKRLGGSPSVSSAASGAISGEIAQWPRRRSLATRVNSAAGRSAGEDSNQPPGIGGVQVQSAAGPDAVGAAGTRRVSGVLAEVQHHRVAGVRIKNGVVWRPENSAQASVRSGSKTVFAHRRQDGTPLEVADRVSCTENVARVNGELLNDVVTLPSSCEESGMGVIDGGVKRNVLSSDQGLDIDAL